MQILSTKRLILRALTLADLDALTAINQDSEVMRYFPGLLSRSQTQTLIKRMIAHQQQHGYSLYAVELKGASIYSGSCKFKSNTQMIGFVGLVYRSRAEFDAPCMPATEISWRLSSNYWRQGYAFEATKAILSLAFSQFALNELVSFTAVDNTPSRRLMKKLGMWHCPSEDFNHPHLPISSPLSRHVLYRLKASHKTR